MKIIMNRLIFILCMLLASVLGHAAPLDREQAEQRTRAFLSVSHEGSAQRRNMMKITSTPFRYLARSEACYVFGFTSGEGIVVAAADDRLPAVLGYSECALPADATMPQNMRSWLLTYDKELKWLNEHGQPTLIAETATESEKVRRLIKPMIATSWGQEAPYNNKVPKEGCPTGCVATAMAQIMYYHQWPQQATTAIPKYYMASAPLEPVVFDWTSMLGSYAGSYSTQSGDAVATLMRYAGQAVRMNYGKDGSGAYAEAVAYALATYFDYDAGMRFVQQAQYSKKEWEDLIYNELSQGRPVFYAGADAWEGGHAFVCDGYSHDGYFHFNWGWDGLYDGYFLLSSMSPMFFYDFGYNHNAVIGIQPDKCGMDAESGGIISASLTTDAKKVYYRATTDDDFSGILIADERMSAHTTDHATQCAIGLYADRQLLRVLGTYNYGFSLKPGDGSSMMYGIDFGAGISDGSYQLRPLSRNVGDDSWTIDLGGDHHFIIADIAGDSLSLRNHIAGEDLHINSIETNGAWTGWDYMIDVTNNGPTFYGPLWLMCEEDSDLVALYEINLCIPAGERQRVPVHFGERLEEGAVYKVCLDAEGMQPIGTVIPTKAEQTLEMNIQLLNVDGDKLIGGVLKLQAVVTNRMDKAFEREFYIGANSRESGDYGSAAKFVRLQPGETRTVNVEFTLRNGLESRLGCKYEAWVETDLKTKVRTAGYELARGALFYHADGSITATTDTTAITVPADALAADMRYAGKRLSKVTPSDNPNCLYLLDANAEVPEGIGNRNVVRGSTAALISLTDGYPFTAPINFQAAKVTYSRVLPDRTWTTLSVPFDAQVPNADEVLLKQWTEEEGCTLRFDDAAAIAAYQPYLVWANGQTLALTATDVAFLRFPESYETAVNYAFGGTLDNFLYFDIDRSMLSACHYAVKSDGSAFELCNEAIEPFRAYFRPLGDRMDEELPVVIEGRVISGIDDVHTADILKPVAMFALDGRRVNSHYRGPVIVRRSDGIVRKILSTLNSQH